MIPLLVPEISTWPFFVMFGILVIGFLICKCPQRSSAIIEIFVILWLETIKGCKNILDCAKLSGEITFQCAVVIFSSMQPCQGCRSRSILPSRMGARGVSLKHVENMENTEKMENLDMFSNSLTEIFSGSQT